MWLRFLPANQAWVFLFGETLNSAVIIPILGDRFFQRRTDAVRAAQAVGLYVTTDGRVS
jgi:hypothetical protein